MTREEAKKLLNKLYARADITDEYGDMEDMQPYEEAVNMAIKALEQEPCEDAISRKQALEIVDNMLMGERNHKSKALDEIKFLPSVTPAQNVCEDAISRSEAIRVASGYCHWTNIPKELAKLPSVSAEKVGCWVEIDDEPHEVWECDHCGFVIDGSGCVDPYEYRDIYKYCPNCGAKMEVEE